MKVLFDTSVLVPAVADQLPNHETALACFVKGTSRGRQAVGSTHLLAETYATLTALPLPKRITAPEARRLVEVNFLSKMELVVLEVDDYRRALEMTSEQGLVSGQIYDALHVVAALKNKCSRIYTYNLRHFRRLAPHGIEITAP